MATRTINITGQSIVANTEKVTTGVTLTSTPTQASIQLTDPNSLWGSIIDNTKHVKCWGVQINRNDGAGWKYWLFQGDPTVTSEGADGGYGGPTGSSIWLPFGSRDRSGGMPALFVGSTVLSTVQGDKFRLAILTDADITLGAVIIIS